MEPILDKSFSLTVIVKYFCGNSDMKRFIPCHYRLSKSLHYMKIKLDVGPEYVIKEEYRKDIISSAF